MKKEYVSPRMVCETFAADEYVAACGDSGTTYYFECDAPGGTLYYWPNSDDTIDGIHQGWGWPERLGSYHPCSKKHKAESTSAFYDGFVDYDNDWRYDEGEEVIVWRGPKGDNGHATKNLDINSWETAKS